MLPELSGVEVCRILRAESSVPIIMLTARDGEVDKVVGLELGADDYVTKPFSLRELTARIRAIFRRAEQAAATQAPPVVDLGRVQVDLAGHRVLRDGQPLPIKPKAFELLAFLVRHPGQVFTRDQLLEHVWGYDYAGETRTVDVHVHWLRSELEEDPSHAAVPAHGARRGLRVPATRRLRRRDAAPGGEADDSHAALHGAERAHHEHGHGHRRDQAAHDAPERGRADLAPGGGDDRCHERPDERRVRARRSSRASW